ncbi:unnamed protein product [Aphanomyces euteiches]
MDISIAKRNRLHILIERGSRPFKHASAHHYIGVDWMAYGAKNMIIDRDACFLEEGHVFLETHTRGLLDYHYIAVVPPH